jgi:hypothetical protein
MTTIYELSETDELGNGDFLPVYSLQNGDARKVSISTLATKLLDVSTNRLTTQYAAPSATAFNVEVTTNTHLILTPAATYANGEITLPLAPADRDEVLVNTTEPVTSLVVDGNGRSVVGAPSTLADNAFFRLKYDAVMSTWYRIG